MLVHCSQGVSRSATLAIAYLMWKRGAGYDDVFREVKAARGVTNPNIGFICQVCGRQGGGEGGVAAPRVPQADVSPRALRWQAPAGCRRLCAGGNPSNRCLLPTPASASQLLQWHKRRHAAMDGCRLYRLAPHSSAAPQYLVPRAATAPAGPGSLDPRGAFVLQGPASLTIWVGAACPDPFLAAAQRFVGQLQKYEAAAGPAALVRQGSEPPAFWTSLATAADGGSSRSGSPAPAGAAAAAAAEALAAAAGAPVTVVENGGYDRDFEVGRLSGHACCPWLASLRCSVCGLLDCLRRTLNGPAA